MATSTTVPITPCNEIFAEAQRLIDAFETCSVLQAADLDALAALAYSASLCGVSDLDQDNIVDLYYSNSITTTGEPTLTQVIAAINATPQFIVPDVGIVIFAVGVNITPLNRTDTELRTQYYVLRGVGKGTYGSGATQLLTNNLFWLRNNYEVTIVSEEDNPPIVYTIGANPLSALDTPSVVVNASSSTYSVIANTDFYFKIYLNGGITDGLKTDDQGSYKLYRFIGAIGEYGIGGGDSTNPADFQLVDDQTEGVAATDNGIKITNYVVPKVIESGNNVSTVVNVMDDITIGTREVASFQCQKAIYDAPTTTFVTEKYFWINGAATIESNSIEADYILYEKESLATVDDVIGGAPTVKDVRAKSLDNPENGVNDSSETYIINGSSDFYFYTYYTNPKKISDATAYKVYRFVGANGTYGFGGSTTVNGDFLEVAADGDSPTIATQDWVGENTNLVKTATIILTAAQIKTLDSIPIVAVQAPGLNKYIKVLSCTRDFKWATTEFDDFMDFHLELDKGSGNQYVSSSRYFNQNSNLFNIDNIDGISDNPANIINKDLVVTADGDSVLTGDSIIHVVITYEIRELFIVV